MANNAPTPYAAPYLDMEKQAQPQVQPTEREYTYTRGDVVYRGDKAREMETAQGLYDSGDYDWVEANQMARQLVDVQKQERKLKAQDALLALGEHKAKLQQKEIENSMMENRQSALAELSSISTDDVVNFSKRISDWRNKYPKAVAFDDVVQKQATQKIKEQEFHAEQMKNMLHASGVDAFVPEVLNDDGSVNMSRASEVGLKMKEAQLKMTEDAKARLAEKIAKRKAEEARFTEEMTGKRPEGELEKAARNVQMYGVEAEVVEGSTKYKMTPSSPSQAISVQTQAEAKAKEQEEKMAQEAKKKGLPLPQKAPAPKVVKFDPNDMKAAKKFMLEKQIEYADILSEDASSAQKLIELARKKGFNIR
jgi:hypothetical protein